MIKERQIRRLEKKRARVQRQLDKLNGREASPLYLNNYRIRITELNDEINRLCAINLEKQNDEFAKLAAKNYEYLQVDNLIFKPYKEEMSYFGSYAKEMHGKLNQNGHIYCNTKTTNNWIFNPFSEYLFPAEFSGRIDCLGNIRLKASKVGGALFKRLPSELKGNIDSAGEIKLTTTKREEDFISGGRILISKIIGQYTFTSTDHSNQFFDNKKLLLSLIKEYREGLNYN